MKKLVLNIDNKNYTTKFNRCNHNLWKDNNKLGIRKTNLLWNKYQKIIANRFNSDYLTQEELDNILGWVK